ncbi:saccharopine dehydrogenase NADP-binding domain-containing protein [Candidatus Uhrbacteria bacterium]|nr:saccharopine dehydrogenase NADP-binding domain-containing protein [Candidatus Uhrbacteria bacterium]
MRYDFLVIGSGGLQGKIVARDLMERGHRLCLADLYRDGSEELLERDPKAAFRRIDLRRFREVAALVARIDAPIVINCAEGDWNIDVYRACLAANRHVIDLGSDIPMTKEQLALHRLFVRAGLTAITGCGSTPGINNVMLKYASGRLDRFHTIEVGFAWDANSKEFVVPFSIESIIEEFTQPAPAIEDGKWVSHKPFDTVIERSFRAIGKQRCFIVRHPETYTFHREYRKNGLKNLRFYAGFPQHIVDVITVLAKLGLGSQELVEVDGIEIRPVDALARTLGRLPIPEGYTETENLWVHVVGERAGAPVEIRMECIVPTLPGWERAGCNIDTGFPASIIAQMIRDGRITARGSFAPGAVVPVESFFQALRERGMVIYENGKVCTVGTPEKSPEKPAPEKPA